MIVDVFKSSTVIFTCSYDLVEVGCIQPIYSISHHQINKVCTLPPTVIIVTHVQIFIITYNKKARHTFTHAA